MLTGATEGFAVATGLVALGEMGDKTQLLSLVLALRFRQKGLILLGILIATLANHGLAGSLGHYVQQWLSPQTLKLGLAASFVLMGLWMLVPDKLDEPQTPKAWGVLLTTIVAFFIAEMGDKTQIATIALAAKYSNLWMIVVATTLGMMIANAPVVWFGERLTRRIPMKQLQRASALLFVVLGVLTYFY